MNARTLLALLLAACIATTVAAQDQKTRKNQQKNQNNKTKADNSYPPKFDGADVEVYKTIGDVKLNIYIFKPEGHQPTDKRPALVCFFGGGWRSGNPRQFEEQCRYFASRGMVAMTADYRVASRHNVKAVDCVKDAKSAIRWVRANAARLGVDPDRIVAAGGSAGGHIAACTGTIKGLEPEGENTSISSQPNAMVLFNPVMSMGAPNDGLSDRDPAEWKQRTGVDPQAISPYHHVRTGLPPTIMFFGTDDGLLAGAKLFEQASRELGNRCDLLTWEGQKHGFFNYGRGDNSKFIATVRNADEFLASIGYLKGKPTIENFMKQR